MSLFIAVTFQLRQLGVKLNEYVNQKELRKRAPEDGDGYTSVYHPQMSPHSVVVHLINTLVWFSR